MKRIKFLLLLCLLFFINNVSAEEITQNGGDSWTGTEERWSGLTSYQSGWSDWSIEEPAVSYYVREVIYLAPDSWSGESCGSEQNEITECGVGTTSNIIRKHTSDNISYYGRNSGTDIYNCPGTYSTVNHADYPDHCTWTWGPETGYCTKPGYAGSCAGTSMKCGTDATNVGYTQACKWIWWENYTVTTTTGSCNSNLQSSSTGCGSTVTGYCYETSSSFSEDKSNWKTSLSSAGGYAKKIYVYSYPMNINIAYDGNGADKLCEAWRESGLNTNSYNSNTHIIYEKGNPTCSTQLTDEAMPVSTLSYNSGGNLSKNKYYRTGHDFIGWVTNKNNANWQLVEDGTVTAYADEASIASDDPIILASQPGDTVTLYAVWKQHEYNITYKYLCGRNHNNQTSYVYGEGSTLKALNTNYCVSDNDGSEFLGWYEDSAYTELVTSIPSTYYKDVTLYAKLSQARYFDYSNGNWTNYNSYGKTYGNYGLATSFENVPEEVMEFYRKNFEQIQYFAVIWCDSNTTPTKNSNVWRYRFALYEDKVNNGGWPGWKRTIEYHPYNDKWYDRRFGEYQEYYDISNLENLVINETTYDNRSLTYSYFDTTHYFNWTQREGIFKLDFSSKQRSIDYALMP